MIFFVLIFKNQNFLVMMTAFSLLKGFDDVLFRVITFLKIIFRHTISDLVFYTAVGFSTSDCSMSFLLTSAFIFIKFFYPDWFH